MPAALSLYQRRELVQRHQQGESFASISRSLGVAYATVRNLYRRYRETGQLSPAYTNCSHTQVRHAEALYAQAVALKQAHPTWGAGLIWTELADHFAPEQLPSKRTLQRWFRRAKLQPPPRDQVPKGRVQRGKIPHAVWALDAKEDIQLADGSYVSWLTLTDEASGAILNAVLFPHSQMDDPRPSSGQSGAASGDDAVGSTRKAAHG